MSTAQYTAAKAAIMSRLEGTQQEIADQVGVSRPLVASWIQGRRTPSLDHLSRLAELAGMELVIEARAKKRKPRKAQ